MLFVIKWGLLAFILLFMGKILPGIEVTSLFAALFATLIIELINIALYPAFILLKQPFDNLTCFIITFLINMAAFFFMAMVLPEFNVEGFSQSVVGAAVFSLIGIFINR